MKQCPREWREVRVFSYLALAVLLLLGFSGAFALGAAGHPPGVPEAVGFGLVTSLWLGLAFFLRKVECPHCKGPFFRSPVSSIVIHPLTWLFLLENAERLKATHPKFRAITMMALRDQEMPRGRVKFDLVKHWDD